MRFRAGVALTVGLGLAAMILAGCDGIGDGSPTKTPVPTAVLAATRLPTATFTPAPTDSESAGAQTTATAAGSNSTDSSTSPAGANTIDVVLTDYRITMFQSDFQVGVTYIFSVQNNGAVAHEFVIEPKGAVDQPLSAGGSTAKIVEIAPGATETLTWTFLQPGDVQFASHLNNDYAQGMVQPDVTVKGS
jgi:uncharacterized cupredoxin-like copper-binding protein